MRRNCSTEEEEEKKFSELEERLRERQYREDVIRIRIGAEVRTTLGRKLLRRWRMSKTKKWGESRD